MHSKLCRRKFHKCIAPAASSLEEPDKLSDFYRWETTQIPSPGQKGRGTACCMKHQSFLLVAGLQPAWRCGREAPTASSTPLLRTLSRRLQRRLCKLQARHPSPSQVHPSQFLGPNQAARGGGRGSVTALIMHAVAAAEQGRAHPGPPSPAVSAASSFPGPGETPDTPPATPHTGTKLSRSVTRVSLMPGGRGGRTRIKIPAWTAAARASVQRWQLRHGRKETRALATVSPN